ncbi:MAG TPA: AAA family ATPase, partial [Spirochaetota bacterium]|nr:AAA family ATPase [Spirochaetota bacterium]
PLELFKVLSKKENSISTYRKIQLIGRDKEIKILKNIVLGDPENKLYVLEGENGVGKSRIVEEFFDVITNNENKIINFTFSGNIYSQNFTWYPFKELFIELSDFIYIDKFKIQKDIFDEFKLQVNYLELFFDNSEKNSKTKISRESLFDTFRILLRSLSNFKRIILIFEDIHFIDDSSIELLKYLIKTLNQYDIYFILSKRTDYKFDIGNSEENLIFIDNLTSVETEIFANNYLDCPISHKLNNYLYEKTSGNPLFLLEIIANLKNNNQIIKIDNIFCYEEKSENSVPDSISGIILARIDKLSYKEKTILNIASFFGYSVSYDLLEKIVGLNDFEKILNNLIEYGFLYLIVENSFRFIKFKNQITVSAIYNSVVERKRKEIHFKIANTLAEEIDKDYEKIAYHFESAKNEFEAIYYYFLSGIKYRNSYDFDTANKHFNKALYYAEKNQNNSKETLYFYDKDITITDFFCGRLFFKYNINVKLSIEMIYYIYGQTLYFSDNNFRTFFEKALSYSEKNNNTLIYVMSKIMLFNYYIYNNEKIDMFSYLNSLEKKVKSLKNDFFLGYFYAQFMTFQIIEESRRNIDDKRYKIIIENFHNAKRIVDNSKIPDTSKRTFYVFWYWNCGLYYKTIDKDVKTIVGVFNLGEQYLIEDYEKMIYYDRIGVGSGPLENTNEQVEYLLKALSIAKRTNSFLKMSHFYSTLAYLSLKKGDFQKSLEYNLESKKICEDIENRFELGMIYKNLGDLNFTMGKYDESIESYLKSIKYKSEFITCQTLVDFANIIFPLSSLVFLYIKINSLKEADDYLFKCYELLSKYNFSRDITIFVEFLKNYLEFKKNKDDKVYLSRMSDHYKDMVKKYPDINFVKWLKKEMIEIEKKSIN